MSLPTEMRSLRELRTQLQQAIVDLERAAEGAPPPRYTEAIAHARAALEEVERLLRGVDPSADDAR